MKPLVLKLSIKNNTNSVVDQMTFQFKANYFGLKALKPEVEPISKRQEANELEIGETIDITIDIEAQNASSVNAKDAMVYPYSIHTAFKCNIDTFFFKVPIHINHLLEVRGELTKIDFKTCWNQSKTTKVYPETAVPSACKNLESFGKLLRENNMFVVQKRKSDDETTLYVSCRAANNKLSFLSASFLDNTMEVEVRSEDPELLDLLYQGLMFLTNN